VPWAHLREVHALVKHGNPVATSAPCEHGDTGLTLVQDGWSVIEGGAEVRALTANAGGAGGALATSLPPSNKIGDNVGSEREALRGSWGVNNRRLNDQERMDLYSTGTSYPIGHSHSGDITRGDDEAVKLRAVLTTE
jgi:hypothetical protein